MKPRSVWLWFLLCLAVLLAALGWVTRSTLRLESERQAAAKDADIQERTRLALWRMDAAASALLIREGARPSDQFRAFTQASNVWSNTLKQQVRNSDLLLPSPLLTEDADYVKLHFELGPGGALSSPQVPMGEERTIAETRFQASEAKIAEAQGRLNELTHLVREHQAKGLTFTWQSPPPPPVVSMPSKEAFKGEALSQSSQVDKNYNEFTKRASALNQAQQAGPSPKPKASKAAERDANVVTILPGQAGPFTPNWMGAELVLVRELDRGGVKYRQGVWLDWPKFSQRILQETADLFPAASLVATVATISSDDPLRLASLPARLVTGPAMSLELPLWTPLRRSLVIAWACVLLAALAVGVLLSGAVALSERRGAFVSAVTHELRTPLTTFRLYAELLANGMLPTREKQTEYLATLQSEAERLSHLVENVLAYARLERGRAKARAEKLGLRELIERVRPALERRVAQADGALLVDCQDDAVVEVDVGAVEQILFNLVDNACKYGLAGASEKIIHLETGVSQGVALLRVRDHGQGIHHRESRRIFRPFHKSAQQAAHSAPGVGLGLALCRKLSRALGGRLRLDRRAAGACFVLEMPVAS